MLNFGLVVASELGDSKTKTIDLGDFKTDDLGRLTIHSIKNCFCAPDRQCMLVPWYVRGKWLTRFDPSQLEKDFQESIASVTNSATILLWTLLAIKMMMHAAREIW